MIRKIGESLGASVLALALCHQAIGAQAALRSNPVPSGSIVIDGSLADWAGVNPYPQDAVGDGSSGPARPLDIDILQGAIAHDANYIYVLWRSAGENMIDGFSNWIFFDMDRNPATGGRGAAPSIPAPGQTSIGYEFNLGGVNGWNAFNAAGAFVGGAGGKTIATGSALGAGGDDFIEWRIDRSFVQPNGQTFGAVGGTQFNLVMIVEDSVGDFSPGNAAQDWYTYDLVPEPATGGLAAIALSLIALRRRR